MFGIVDRGGAEEDEDEEDDKDEDEDEEDEEEDDDGDCGGLSLWNSASDSGGEFEQNEELDMVELDWNEWGFVYFLLNTNEDLASSIGLAAWLACLQAVVLTNLYALIWFLVGLDSARALEVDFLYNNRCVYRLAKWLT